jgi:hypothetical protein
VHESCLRAGLRPATPPLHTPPPPISYVFKVMGGQDKQGFPMKQGVLTNLRVRLLMSPGDQCFRGHGRRNGERRRKSVRGCIISPDLSVLNLVIVKKGEKDLPGLTDEEKPRMRGPKRASKVRRAVDGAACGAGAVRCSRARGWGRYKRSRLRPGRPAAQPLTPPPPPTPHPTPPPPPPQIRKLFALSKDDDVRRYVNTYRRTFEDKKGKKHSKAPKIQRLVTPVSLQRKRRRAAIKKSRHERARTEAAEYHKLLVQRIKEQRERRSESLAKKRATRMASQASKE